MVPEISCSIAHIIPAISFSVKKELRRKFPRNASPDRKNKGSKAQMKGVGAGAFISSPDAGQRTGAKLSPTGALRYTQHSKAKSCLESSDFPEYFLNKLG